MFMLKSLYQSVWGNPNTQELAKIDTGELYIIRPKSSVKGARECIFQNAMATVRRTSQDFHYQLVITRVFEEGEEALVDEDEETEDEITCLIDADLQFREESFDGHPTLVWRDFNGDDDDLYEFAVTNADAPTRIFFETAVLRAMYERKYHKSSDRAKDADLKALLYVAPKAAPGSRPKPSPTSAKANNAEAVATKLASTSISDSGPSSSAPQSMPEPEPYVGVQLDPNAKLLLSSEAELLHFDYDADAFASQAMVKADIYQNRRGGFDYFLVAEEEGGQKWLVHEVSSDLNCKWSKKWTSFRWNHVDAQANLSAWCLRFSSDDVYEEFREVVTRCIWETSNGISWDKAKKEDTGYAVEAFKDQDVEMTDAYESEQEEEDAVESVLDSDSDEESSDVEEEDEEAEKFHAKTEGAEVNTGLAVGYKSGRTFVIRGGRIGVFKHPDDDSAGVLHDGTINKITTIKGKSFAPKKAMLHEQDSAMVLMNPTDPHNLYKMDLTVGKVVEEWNVHPDIEVNHIAPDSKFAQMTHTKTLVGASHNGLFRIDPRVSGKKLVDEQYKQYATKAAFSGLATTGSGHVAVASAKGDVRLFDTIGKIAKTALPALGDPIIGVDVSACGRWLVATCKTHLYVIDTRIADGKFAGRLGFERSFPANARPVPKRLQLKPEHVAFMRCEPSFTTARFDVGPDQEETSIVTSSGPFVVAWDFKKVKKGILDSYEIKQYDDNVVQDEFRYANDRDIVVALKNNVVMVNKKKLRKPTRKSLSTPARQLRSATKSGRRDS